MDVHILCRRPQHIGGRAKACNWIHSKYTSYVKKCVLDSQNVLVNGKAIRPVEITRKEGHSHFSQTQSTTSKFPIKAWGIHIHLVEIFAKSIAPIGPLCDVLWEYQIFLIISTELSERKKQYLVSVFECLRLSNCVYLSLLHEKVMTKNGWRWEAVDRYSNPFEWTTATNPSSFSLSLNPIVWLMTRTDSSWVSRLAGWWFPLEYFMS